MRVKLSLLLLIVQLSYGVSVLLFRFFHSRPLCVRQQCLIWFHTNKKSTSCAFWRTWIKWAFSRILVLIIFISLLCWIFVFFFLFKQFCCNFYIQNSAQLLINYLILNLEQLWILTDMKIKINHFSFWPISKLSFSFNADLAKRKSIPCSCARQKYPIGRKYLSLTISSHVEYHCRKDCSSFINILPKSYHGNCAPS